MKPMLGCQQTKCEWRLWFRRSRHTWNYKLRLKLLKVSLATAMCAAAELTTQGFRRDEACESRKWLSTFVNLVYLVLRKQFPWIVLQLSRLTSVTAVGPGAVQWQPLKQLRYENVTAACCSCGLQKCLRIESLLSAAYFLLVQHTVTRWH